MKLIDEKGKLFGIVNIIDLVVLLVVVLAVGAVGYKLLGDKIGSSTGIDTGTKDVIVTIKCIAKNEAAAKALKVGDQLISLTSYQPAYVESVSYEAATEESRTEEGQIIMVKHPIEKDVFVKVKMKLNTSADVMKLGSQDVAISKGFSVKTHNVELAGIIQDIQK